MRPFHTRLKMNIQKSPFLVVATEPTPNPAAFKFNLNQQAAASTHAYNNEFEAEGGPLLKSSSLSVS